MPVIECDVDAARDRLEQAGVTVEPGNTDHERWRASRGDATAVAYDDKVVVQGGLRGISKRSSGWPRTCLLRRRRARQPGPRDRLGGRHERGIVAEGSETIGRATNNQAEYEALIAALEAARDYGYDEIHVRGDPN